MLEHLTDELFCIAIIIVLLLGVYTQKGNFSNHHESTKRYTLILYADLFFLCVTIASELVEGKTEYTFISYILNTLVFISIDLMLLAFTAYLSSLIKTNKGWVSKAVNVVVCTIFVRIITIIVMTATGKLFTIEDGCYIDQGNTYILYIIAVVTMIELAGAVLFNRKYFTTREFVVMLIYIALPLAPAIVEMFTSWYALTVISTTLSLLIVYILVQAVTIESGKARESMLEEVSSTDFLTRLPNRRAYYIASEAVSNKDGVGVIFCDINGLKYTNDNFGHAAGDELIIKFAGILTKLFNNNDVYRISGDEFLILCHDTSRERFNSACEKLKSAIADNNKIAAVGSYYGKGKDIEYIVTMAEGEMYEDKKEYHNNHSR